MEKQISIIIPTYNMEAYIGKCLDSLLIPEFGQVEVWVVNDGSKDRSSEIAHSYADRYPDSIHVLDKPNGNYGSCINAALPLCTGRYIKILDADDTFNKTVFSKFVNALRHCDEDVIITNFEIVYADGEIKQKSEFSDSTKLDISIDFIEASTTVASKFIQMHRLAYKSSVFDLFNYKQTEGISYTDTQWSIMPMAFCRTFRCIDLYVYHYLTGREGQTMTPENIRRSLTHFFKALEDLISWRNKLTLTRIYKEYLDKLILDRHQYVYGTAISNISAESMNALKSYDEWLKSNAFDIYMRVGEINYDDNINYKIYNDVRNKNYTPRFTVPLWHKAKLSIKLRIQHLFNGNNG